MEKSGNQKTTPLVNGIRQVGKTWSIKNFGEKHFNSVLYVNFDLEPTYGDIFKGSKENSV
ncbi:MAG: AAA family ATPase [Spirochaetales bacterium]|nr:AAA family ATPase [Spirochaetales bacterium]